MGTGEHSENLPVLKYATLRLRAYSTERYARSVFRFLIRYTVKEHTLVNLHSSVHTVIGLSMRYS